MKLSARDKKIIVNDLKQAVDRLQRKIKSNKLDSPAFLCAWLNTDIAKKYVTSLLDGCGILTAWLSYNHDIYASGYPRIEQFRYRTYWAQALIKELEE